MSRWSMVAAAIGITCLGLCVRAELVDEPIATAPPPLPDRPASRPGLDREAARLALARDAWRREDRFASAVDPAAAWAALRVEAVAQRSQAELFTLGERLFRHTFTREEGFGSKDHGLPRRVHDDAGGPDAHRCVDCHHRGGPAGAGALADHAYLAGDGDQPQAAIVRSPPSLVGAGVVARLAEEMSVALQGQRDAALEGAKAEGADRSAELSTKGVSFGAVVAHPDGTWDAKLQGIDRDLVVKPFGWSGHTTSLTRVVEDQLQLHHGMQTTPGDDDGDGVHQEITPGQLLALTTYVALQEIPTADLPTDAAMIEGWAQGQGHFEAFGCADCHRPSLPLDEPSLQLAAGDLTVTLDLREGAEPRLEGPGEVHLYSDLKRHVVGPNLRDPRSHHGVSPAAFLTPPLWGLARSAPYMHDGRAPTLHDAIVAHSGEADRSRQAYEKAPVDARGELRIYLLSLTRAPRFTTE